MTPNQTAAPLPGPDAIVDEDARIGAAVADAQVAAVERHRRLGEPVGAVYGYTTMLWKLADELHKADGPTHMAVILDKSESTFRNEMYADYKAHRPEPPEDLRPQFPMVREATRALSLPCIELADLEADDIIAC